jgi:hypothetical protein
MTRGFLPLSMTSGNTDRWQPSLWIVPTSIRKVFQRAKELVASGLQRAVMNYSLDEVASAAVCSPRCIQKALSHETLPEAHTLVNLLRLDSTALCEFFGALGFKVVPAEASMSPDMLTVKRMSDTLSCYLTALQDGRRDHRETLELANHLRPLVQELTAIIHEADGLRRVA